MSFNSFRQNLYRFFSKQKKDQHSAAYPFLNKRIFALGQFFKSKEPVEKGVEFFFYTDEENKANNLAIELKKMGYEIYNVDPPQSWRKEWSVTGRTDNVDFDEEALNRWSQQMIELGYECDCEFDGWGTLL